MLLLAENSHGSSIRHSFILGIANQEERLERGPSYPYHVIKRDAYEQYIEIDCEGWVEGNVLNYSYSCPDCRK